MDDYQGDPSVATAKQASPDQVAALQKQYQPRSAAPAAPAPKAAPEETPLIGKAAAAKAFQSATFGFGADLSRMLINKQTEQSIRQLSTNYDKDHPLAGFAIDLAVAGAYSAVPGVGAAKDADLAVTGLKMVGKQAITGAGIGALSGAGAGGDMAQRGKQAAEGAIVGGLGGAGAAYLGAAAKPVSEWVGASSARRSAAGAVNDALKADGKSMADLTNFLKANPDARIADFSPKVKEAVGKAAALTNKTSDTLGDAIRSDKEAQAPRLAQAVAQAQPLQKTKQQMIDNITDLEKQRKATYTLSKSELAPITPELQKILDHPEVKPLYDKAIKDFGAGKRAGVADLQLAPKYKVGQELPSAALDDLQKSIGRAAQDEGPGSIRYGTLKAAQDLIKTEQGKSGHIADAHALAARLGGEDSNTGLLGAQAWGHSYAFGLKNADIADFRKMNPEQQEYAKLGMVSGMEKYLNDAGRMTEGSLSKIADKLRDPQVEEVLGAKGANDVRKVFQKEAARMRVSAQMQSGGSRKAAFNEENEARMVAHAANVVVGGAGHILGTGMRILSAHGISEKQATAMIDIASKPGGIARLEKAGMDKRVIDVISSAVKRKGVISGKLAAQGNLSGEQ